MIRRILRLEEESRFDEKRSFAQKAAGSQTETNKFSQPPSPSGGWVTVAAAAPGRRQQFYIAERRLKSQKQISVYVVIDNWRALLDLHNSTFALHGVVNTLQLQQCAPFQNMTIRYGRRTESCAVDFAQLGKSLCRPPRSDEGPGETVAGPGCPAKR